MLVAHSMGGLVARRAVERLGPRLRGLLLLDPTPESAPDYDTFDRTAAKVDRALGVTQALARFRPMARLASGNVRRIFPAETYATMLAEDFVPAGTAQGGHGTPGSPAGPAMTAPVRVRSRSLRPGHDARRTRQYR